MKNFTFALMTLSLFFYTSCVKEVGTSNSNVVFQLNTATSPVSGAAITWTIGSAGITAASIQGRKNDSAIVIFKSDVKAAVDLFGAVNFANVSVPVGKYRNVAFKIDLQDIGGKSPLRLEGTFKAGTTVTPIVLKQVAVFQFNL